MYQFPKSYLGDTRQGVESFTYCMLYIKKDLTINKYRNDPKFSDRYAWANSVDPDQTAPRGAV